MTSTENTQTTADAALEAATDADRFASAAGSFYCGVSNLVTQVANGNRRPWVLAAVGRLGTLELDADLVELARIRSRAAADRAAALAAIAYRELLEADEAFTVVDHSDRLDTRPYEVALSTRLRTATPHVTAHGSSLRLARYATLEAAERAIVKLTAAELARLAADAQPADAPATLRDDELTAAILADAEASA